MRTQFRAALIAVAISVVVCACGKTNRCEMYPADYHPSDYECMASIQRWYFDSKDDVCKKFDWGGCNDVKPFESREACEAECK